MASTVHPAMPSMPGSYLFQHDHFHEHNKSQNVFRPPAPSSTPSRRNSQIPRPTSRSSNSHSGRKRPRLDTNTSYFSRPARPSTSNTNRSTTSTPYLTGGSYDHVTFESNLDSSAYSLEDHTPWSPSPLANSNYRLAGGLDTPSASIERGLDEIAQDEAEKDYRFNRYTSTANTSRSTFSAIDNTTKIASQSHNSDLRVSNNDTRARKRSHSPPKSSVSLTGWGLRSTAWALTGGLAGRVFTFCINTAFRGFRAGGGDPYQFPSEAFYQSSDVFFNHDLDQGGNRQGGCPRDFGGFVEDYVNSPESKRKISDHDFQPTPLALKNDWQIVDPVNMVDSGDEQSPVRKRSRASVAGAWQRPGTSRISTAGRSSTSTGASFASARCRSSVGAHMHQPQRSNSNHSDPFQPPRRTHPSFDNRPSRPHSRSNSYLTANVAFAVNQAASVGHTSPSRPSSSASTNHPRETSASNGNLSPEVQNYRRKLKARERAQDDNLRRLNAQLRDMIREGKEALGSRVEVFDDGGNTDTGGAGRGRDLDAAEDVDEGFYEDRWD